MKNKTFAVLASTILAVFNSQLSTACAQGTAFTYQGRLNNNGSPASGLYDYRFKLYSDPLGNTQVGASYLTNAVAVSNGLFLTALDFGAGIFTGSNYWLEVDVRTNGAGGYTVLNPLQDVTPMPYAVFATTAGNVSGTVTSANLSGTYGNAVTLNNAGNGFSGAFSGNGANVTNVNAAALNGMTSSNFWQLGGNAVSAGQFLGSTNNQPVEIWVNGTRALRLEPNATAPNVVGGSVSNSDTATAGVLGSTIGGGIYNTNGASYAFIGGGKGNTIQAASPYSVLVGGNSNNIQSESYNSVLGGGSSNSIQSTAYYSALVGGQNNLIQVNADYAFLGGGRNNIIEGATVTDMAAFLGGGSGNGILTNATYAFLGGGYKNTIGLNDTCAVIVGGTNNTIQPNAPYSVLVGGANNSIGAGAQYALAAGQQAQALFNGDFVWADSQNAPFASTANNQFLIRAGGGVGIGATNLAVGGALTIRQPVSAPPSSMLAADNALVLGSAGVSSYKWLQSYGGSLALNPLGNNVGVNTNNPTHPFQVINAYCDGSSWVNVSDRNLKQGFAPVDARAVLAKVAALPVQSWVYKAQPEQKHVGPVAQDFHAAFGLGHDDTSISTVDEGGVALAAIQGLNQKVEEKEARIQEQAGEIQDLKVRLEKLEQLMVEKLGGAK